MRSLQRSVPLASLRADPMLIRLRTTLAGPTTAAGPGETITVDTAVGDALSPCDHETRVLGFPGAGLRDERDKFSQGTDYNRINFGNEAQCSSPEFDHTLGVWIEH